MKITIKNVFKANTCSLKLNSLLKLKNKSLCRGSPDKPLSFVEYISIKSYVPMLNHVLRVFRHVKIIIKKCFENKWLILKVKFITETCKQQLEHNRLSKNHYLNLQLIACAILAPKKHYVLLNIYRKLIYTFRVFYLCENNNLTVFENPMIDF